MPRSPRNSSRTPSSTSCPGPGVGHEIFGNECDQLGRDNYPEACVDAPGVDRAKLHDAIGQAAVTFFDKTLGVRRQGAP